MEILQSTIQIGLKNPVGVLHITDSHLPQYKPDDEDISAKRLRMEKNLRESLEYAEARGLTVIHTGDIMSYCNEQNLAAIDQYFNGRNCIVALGNHDFCRENDSNTDPGSFEKNLGILAPHFNGNLLLDSRIIGGELNVVSMFNGFFQIRNAQLEMLQAEAAKGLPILLCMHIPLFTPEHAAARMRLGGSAHLLGPSDEYLARYPEKYQYQKADKDTLHAIEYIRNEKAIKAILAGHTHLNFEEVLESGTVQIVTSGTHKGCIREITVK